MPKIPIGAIQPRRLIAPGTAPAGTVSAFTPSWVFRVGMQGLWLDPSDIASMFQDAAGKIPAAFDNPVGLILDKSGIGNHASQSTLTARPVLKRDETGRNYLLFDGVDDFLVTQTVNFGATNIINAFAGVRKLSDAAAGIIFELSATTTTNNNAFALFSGSGVAGTGASRKNYGAALSSSSLSTSGGTVTPLFTSPTTNTLRVEYNGTKTVSTDAIAQYVNGVQRQATYDVTSIDTIAYFGAYPIYIGMRGGVSIPFSGRVYSLMIVGAQLNNAFETQCERWVNNKTGAY